MLNSDQIPMRDPYVLPVAAEGQYYLYGTTDKNIWQGEAEGIDCYRSQDLHRWEGPFPAFRRFPGFWANENYWAPEVSAYQGRYYMFASFTRTPPAWPNCRRGTQVLVADRPEGPFQPHSADTLTPTDQMAYDGTLFFGPDGEPWMVYCHDYAQIFDATMMAVRLSPDLTHRAGEPHRLFRASEAPWSTRVAYHPTHKERECFLVDGPSFHRTRGGRLLMVWSGHHRGSYAVGVAFSTDGSLLGPWQHEAVPLATQDGGHCMLFQTFAGQMMMSLHRPNRTPEERPVFLPVREENETLVLA